MSSIFGSSVDDTGLGLNSTFLVGVTSTTEAIQILDQQLTIFNESNLTNDVSQPLNDVINLMNQRITDVADGLSNNLTASNVKTLYESNPDTNAYTDADKLAVTNIGTYIDETELATALSEYRLAIDQDTIDSGKYSTSNPAGYQTSSQVVNSISDGLVPYRTSLDQDTIDAGKLNTADLKSDIVIHPSSGGGPTTYEGTVCCGAIELGLNNINGTLIPQFPGLDIYDFSCNGVVNFKGSNYYSFNFGQNAGSIAFVKETANVYVNVDKADIFGANPGTFVYKFATNGTILCAIAKQSSTKFFWTTDGVTWNDYDISDNIPLRALDIIDNVIYTGNDLNIYKITDVNNPSFIVKSTSSNANKFFKYLGDVYYLVGNGMYDWNSQTLISGLPPLPSQGDVTMANAIVDSSDNIYLITALDNNIWKFANGVFTWNIIATTDFQQTYAIHQYNGIIYLGGYNNDFSRYGTLIADTFTSVPTGNDSNRQDSGNWYIYGFGDIYSSSGMIHVGISVTLDADVSTTTNVFDTLTDLATANTEVRSNLASFVTITDVNDAISTSQSTQDSSIASTYQTQAAMGSYLTTSSASSTYRTIADSYSANEINSTLLGYVTNTNLTSNYSTTSAMNTAITNANNTQDASIASTYQTIAGMSPYYTASQTNTAISSALTPYSTSAQIASTYASLTQFGYLLRPGVKIVQIAGGSTTPATGQAYSTIASALAAALPNEIVFIMPGTYLESGLTIPAGVELRGLSRFSVLIRGTPTTSTTMVTIGGANCKMTEISIECISSTNGANLTGVSISSTYNTTFFMRNCSITITQTIGNTDTANAIAFDSTATGAHANDAIFNYIDSIFRVDANGLGIKRCVRSTGVNSDLHFDTCQFSCLRSSAGSDYIAFEVNGTSADSQITNSYLNGTNADISATLGFIQLGKSTVLLNANCNNIAFTTLGGSIEYFMTHIGGAGANRFLTPAGEVNNEVSIRMSKPTVIYGLYYNSRVQTAGVETVTINKNGVATALTVTVTNTTSGSNTTNAIQFATGDLLSIAVNKVSGTVTDYTVQFSAY